MSNKKINVIFQFDISYHIFILGSLIRTIIQKFGPRARSERKYKITKNKNRFVSSSDIKHLRAILEFSPRSFTFLSPFFLFADPAAHLRRNKRKNIIHDC